MFKKNKIFLLGLMIFSHHVHAVFPWEIRIPGRHIEKVWNHSTYNRLAQYYRPMTDAEMGHGAFLNLLLSPEFDRAHTNQDKVRIFKALSIDQQKQLCHRINIWHHHIDVRNAANQDRQQRLVLIQQQQQQDQQQDQQQQLFHLAEQKKVNLGSDSESSNGSSFFLKHSAVVSQETPQILSEFSKEDGESLAVSQETPQILPEFSKEDGESLAVFQEISQILPELRNGSNDQSKDFSMNDSSPVLQRREQKEKNKVTRALNSMKKISNTDMKKLNVLFREDPSLMKNATKKIIEINTPSKNKPVGPTTWLGNMANVLGEVGLTDVAGILKDARLMGEKSRNITHAKLRNDTLVKSLGEVFEDRQFEKEAQNQSVAGILKDAEFKGVNGRSITPEKPRNDTLVKSLGEVFEDRQFEKEAQNQSYFFSVNEEAYKLLNCLDDDCDLPLNKSAGFIDRMFIDRMNAEWQKKVTFHGGEENYLEKKKKEKEQAQKIGKTDQKNLNESDERISKRDIEGMKDSNNNKDEKIIRKKELNNISKEKTEGVYEIENELIKINNKIEINNQKIMKSNEKRCKEGRWKGARRKTNRIISQSTEAVQKNLELEEKKDSLEKKMNLMRDSERMTRAQINNVLKSKEKKLSFGISSDMN